MRDPQAQDAHAAALDVLLAFIDTHKFVGETDVRAARAALATLRSRLVVLEQERDESREKLGALYVAAWDVIRKLDPNVPWSAQALELQHALRSVGEEITT